MALFKTIEEVTAIAPINASFTLDALMPSIKIAEAEFIKTILGEVEYALLENAYQDNTLTAEQDLLLAAAQQPLAWLALYKWVPMGNIDVTAGGFRVAVDSSSAPASQWRVNDFIQECRKNGFNLLETSLLELLWNSTAGDYADWEESTEYIEHRTLLIYSAKTFQKFVDIENSVEVFRKLKPFILLVEENHILPIVGQELYDDIKDDVLNDTLSVNNEYLMQSFIRPCVANYAMANGALRIMLVLEAYGIIQKSKSERENVNVETPGKDNLVSAYIQMCQRNGQLYENKLRQYLKNNSATYPLYANSTAFEDTADDDSDGDNVNDQDSGYYKF